MKEKWIISISIGIMLLVQLSASEYVKEYDLSAEDKTNIKVDSLKDDISVQKVQREENPKKQTHKKYNQEEMENSEFITVSEFDEWLKVNDHYEAFVKAYNSSPTHPYVKKVKCLYELGILQSEDFQISQDEMQMKCSNQK